MAIDPKSNAALEVSDQAEFMHLLKNAPIEEFAEYMGGDLNLAVQLRIDEAVRDTYDKVAARQGVIAEDIYGKWAAEQGQADMDITVRPIEPQGNLYGFASVTVGGIRIDDFKIVENKDGDLFVGMPSKPDKESDTGYRNTVYVDKDYREDFSAAVIGKYHEAVEKAQNRAASLNRPERMADQVAKAQKEAEKHNAALPPKGKGAKAHGERE